MELPIDHFRLLGVNASSDRQTVLRTLQQRLDRIPDQGFTQDTLQARAELLEASADLLSDETRRQAYERELTAIADNANGSIAALEIPPSSPRKPSTAPPADCSRPKPPPWAAAAKRT